MNKAAIDVRRPEDVDDKPIDKQIEVVEDRRRQGSLLKTY